MSHKNKIAKLQARIAQLEGGDFYNKSQEALNSQARQIRHLKGEVRKLENWRVALAITTVLAIITAGDNFIELVLGVF